MLQVKTDVIIQMGRNFECLKVIGAIAYQKSVWKKTD